MFVCLFVSRVSFCYCLTNVSIFAVFPKKKISSANSLAGAWFRDPGLDPFYRIIETGLIYLGPLNPITADGMLSWV